MPYADVQQSLTHKPYDWSIKAYLRNQQWRPQSFLI